VILCSGKFIYEIIRLLEKSVNYESTLIVTIEELLPFPEEILHKEVFSHLAKECEISWV
jgi:2-oxoglutarate dehydrogenase complex dehydrogenase (E1) component-like enzyme